MLKGDYAKHLTLMQIENHQLKVEIERLRAQRNEANRRLDALFFKAVGLVLIGTLALVALSKLFLT